MASYTLILPIGKITYTGPGSFRGQTFSSSELDNSWSPTNPINNGGWQPNDTLTVVCGFHVTKILDSDGQPYPTQPNPSDFHGLSVSALYNPTDSDVSNEESILRSKLSGSLGSGITKSQFAGSDYIFYNAQSFKEDISLVPSSRGALSNIIYKWTMDYNPNFNGVHSDKIDIVFGYGDPMVGDDKT